VNIFGMMLGGGNRIARK